MRKEGLFEADFQGGIHKEKMERLRKLQIFEKKKL